MSLEAITISIQSLIDEQRARGLEPYFTVGQIQRRSKHVTGIVPSPTQVLEAIKQQPVIRSQKQEYVPVIEAEGQLSPGQISQLSGTGNPKNGTEYRRNSTVIERNRPDPNWPTNSRARELEMINTKISAASPNELAQARKAEQETKRRKITEKQTSRANKRELRDWQLAENPLNQTLTTIRQQTSREGIANLERLEALASYALTTIQPLDLISIWGPPYVEQDPNSINIPNTPEYITASQLAQFLTEPGIAVKTNFTLIYADLYGAINGMPEAQIYAYGEGLRKWCITQGVSFTAWSYLAYLNRDRYLPTKQAVQKSAIPFEKEIASAMATQEKLGNVIDRETASTLAIQYRIERLTEGILLTNGLRLFENLPVVTPVKIATAPSRLKNDDPYEPDLPRIYLNILRAPWNKER